MSTKSLQLAAARIALLCSLVTPVAVQAQPSSSHTTAIEGVTVVDTRTGKLAPGRTVLVQDGRITRISAAGRLSLPPGAQRVDAQGKFVVPGYLDMHAHPLDPAEPSLSLPLMVSYGITGYRQMGGSPALLKLKREGRLPQGIVPRPLAIPGRVLAGPAVATPEGARATVRQQKADGADFIKAVDMPQPAYFAAMAEAHELGLSFVGHLPPSIDVREAARRGMKSIEHLGPHVSLLEACSSDEAAIRAKLRAVPPGGSRIAFDLPREQLERLTANPVLLTPPPFYHLIDMILTTQDDGKCRDLAQLLKAVGNWQVPTLIREKSMQFGNDSYFRDDARLRFVPQATRRLWSEVGADFDSKLTAEQKRTMARLFDRQLALVKLFDAAGVKMLAGSDMGGVWLIPGVSLHQEFELLAQAGLAPLRVLQMTTLYGAQFMGLEKEMGTVEPGKLADLVLLDADPLKDSRNLGRIAGVMLAGRYLSFDELRQMQDKVAADAAKQP